MGIEKARGSFWTIGFSIISIILFELALFVPEQRLMISGFLAISLIFTIILFYINKINSNENEVNEIKEKIKELSNNITEKFNYLKEIYNLKVEIEMLKKRGKKAQINLLDLLKIIIALILLYVIFEVIKTIN